MLQYYYRRRAESLIVYTLNTRIEGIIDELAKIIYIANRFAATMLTGEAAVKLLSQAI
jgi:hypothetical protein